MGKHSGRTGNTRSLAVYSMSSYEARHVDTDRQPGRLAVDNVPDEWFDPAIDRNPNDDDLGARMRLR